ncbi:MAG: AAA family ATPase [bacterium]|nr:AAA family ATPase [bacterium]
MRKLDKHVALELAKRDAPQREDHVWTRFANELLALTKTAVLLECIGVGYSPAGCGKTLTAGVLLDVIPGSMLVTISDGVHTPTAFIRELAGKLKLGSGRGTRSLRRAICDHLRGSKRLIMVDECHLAILAVLNTIRQLHDATGCPVVLIGLPALGRTIMNGRGDDAMGATLFSRCGIIRDLTARCRQEGDRGEPLFSREDVKRVFARSQLRIAREALDWLEGVANEPESGGLRLASNGLRLATHAARKSHGGVEAITVEALLDASRLLKGTEAANAITNRIKQRRTSKVA